MLCGAAFATGSPSISSLIMNSTSGDNVSSDNLTAYATSTDKVFYNWFVNNQPFALLNMPVDGGALADGNTTVRDYATGHNGAITNGGNVIYNSTGGFDGNGAYEFNGNPGAINPSMGINPDTVTISFWIKPRGSSPACDEGLPNNFIVGSVSRHWGISRCSYGGNNYISAWAVFGGGNANTTYVNDEWNYITFVHSNGTAYIYLDGVLQNSGPMVSLSGSSFEIGHDDVIPDVTFNGTIDELLVFNRALSSEEIMALYNNQSNKILSSELTLGDTWRVEAYPNDNTADGTKVVSSDLVIGMGPPRCVAADNSTFVCGQAVTESCVLNNDISSAGTCFTISAADVTIDCAGHSITGDDTDRTYGISSSEFNTTINNCVISRFSTAVFFNGATNGTIRNVTANTTLSQWGGDGSTGDGIALYGAAGNTITGSRAYSQNSYAIRILTGSSNNTVVNSTATANYYALSIDNSPSNTIANSTVSANDWSMDIRSSYNTVVNTTFISSGGSGRLLMIGSGASGNTICWNNFTATSGEYSDDENGSNYYYSSICNGEGNLWANVLSGGVDVRGTVHSTGFPIMYIGSNGTGLPYGDSTSGGKTIGVSDFAPITPTHDGPVYINDCTVITGSGVYYLNQSIPSASSDCIQIRASDVSLDCQGYTITASSPTDRTIGTYNSLTNVSILNCNLVNGAIRNNNPVTQLTVQNVNITNIYCTTLNTFGATVNRLWINNSDGVALCPWIMDNSAVSNSTFISGTSYALSPSGGEFSNNNFTSNAFISGSAAIIGFSSAGGNRFTLNNFTCTGACELYINDTSGGNYYDMSVDGLNQGNIYPNVASGAVDVRGESASSIPGLYVGSDGSGYPYNSVTSGGMVTSNVVDNAPLTARRICDYYIGQANMSATLSSPNSVYCLNESVATSSTAITVAANGVTLDCRGHSINGDGTSSQSAVYSNQAGTIVSNCAISGYYFGIYFYGASNGQITNDNISGAHEALRLEHNSGNNQISNIVASASDDALGLQDQSNGNNVSNLTATAGGNAIAFYDAHNNLLYNNTFAVSIDSGNEVYFDLSADNNTLYWNTFTNTSDYYVDDTNGGNYFNLTRDSIDSSAYDGSLVSLYRAEGNANDELGNNNAAWTGASAYAAGHYGQAFSFDGTGSGNISVPDSPGLSPSEITVSAWVYITGSPESYPSIACKSNMPGSVGYCLHVIGGNYVKFWINDGSHYAQSGALPLNTWVHVVGTYGPSTDHEIRMYVDGTLAYSGYYNDPILPSSDPLTIGNYPYSGTDNGLFEGSIDNVAIFNKSLSAAQVEELYNSSYNRGNNWANVVSGEVNITGNEPSAYGSGWYVGSAGSDYPYSSTTSGGMVTSNVVDYAPLVTHCRPQMIIEGGSSPVTLDCEGSTYTLTGDLTVSDNNAVYITADNIKLDCSGNAITGNTRYSYLGIYSYYYNTTIVNCDISDFYDGIYFQDEATFGTIANNSIHSTTNGVYLDSGAGNTVVEYNNFTDNNAGFYVYDSDNNQIRYNVLTSTWSSNFGGSSCPLVYAWNGTGYAFASDFSTAGRLKGKSKAYYDYLKVPGAQLAPLNGEYKLQITEEEDEISYIDQLSLYTVDHSPDVDIYTGMNYANKSTMYTVGKSLISPVSCTDESGNDCLTEVSSKDGVYTPSPVENGTKTFVLGFANLSSSSDIKLLITYSRLAGLDLDKSTKNRSVQIKAKNGTWVSAFAESDLIPLPNAPNTYVLDLTGKFKYDYSVKLVFPEEIIDYFAVDTSSQQAIAVSNLSASAADLHYRGYSQKMDGLVTNMDYNTLVPMTYSEPSGNFTRYGNVAPLLLGADNQYVILHDGDEISVKYPYTAPVDGMVRDFLVYGWYYYKPAKNYGDNYTTTPLPFKGMSKYPYRANESYPLTAENQQYLSEYDTREITSVHAGGALPNSFNNTVLGNFINGSTDSTGLTFSSEDTSYVLSNSITGVSTGISVSDSSGMVLDENNLTNIGYNGIYFDWVSDSNITSNNISSTTSQANYGVEMYNSLGNYVASNNMSNFQTGIYAHDSNTRGNTFEGNWVDNAMVGVDISSLAESNTLSNNIIHAGKQPVWFYSPTYLAYGPDGYIYVSDVNNARIRRINPATGATSLVAGGNFSENYIEGIGAAAGISNPGGLAFGSDGYLYFADSNNRRVRKINITTNETFFVAGSGDYSSLDGIGANASFESPTGLAFGPDGYLYVADNNGDNNGMLRAINVTTGEVTTIIASDFSYAYSIAFGPDGYLYAVDTNNGKVDQFNITTDDTLTIASGFYYPDCAIIGPDGYLYLAAYGDVDRIDLATSEVSLIANGFNHAFGLAFDADGYLYVSDVDNQVMDKINVTTGDVSLLAGKPGTSGYLANPEQLAALRVVYDASYNTISGNTFASESGPATYLVNSPNLDFTNNTLSALNGKGIWISSNVFNSSFVGNNITASTWVDEGDPGMCTGDFTPCTSIDDETQCGNQYGCYWSEGACYLNYGEQTCIQIRGEAECTRSVSCAWSPNADSFNDSEIGNIYYFANGTPSWQVYDISSSTGGHWADQGSDWPFSASLNSSTCTAQAEETSCTESEFWLGDVSGDWGGEIGVGSAPFDDDWETGTQPTSDTGSFYVVYGIQSNYINATVRVASSEESAEFLVPDECYLDGIGINITTDKINSQINVSCFNGDGDYVPLGQINGSTFNEQEMIWALQSPPWIGGGKDYHPYVGSAPAGCLNLSDESTWGGRISYSDECDLSGFIFGSTYSGPCYYAQSSFGMCPGQYDSYSMVANSTDITIDCAGSTLIGNGSTLGIIINQSGTSVKNCILQNFTVGISIGAPEAYTRGDSISNTTINLTEVPDCSIFGTLCAGMVMVNLIDSNFTGINIDARSPDPDQPSLYIPLVAEEVENLTFENIVSNSSFNLGLIFMDAPGTVLSNVTSVTSYSGSGFIPYYGTIALLGAPNSAIRNVTGTSGYMGFFDMASPNTTFADSSFSGASTDFLIDSSVCSGSFTNVNGSNGLPILVYSSEGQAISGVNASMIALCGANYSSISDTVVNSSGIQIYDTSHVNITNISSASPHSYTLYMQGSSGISVANSTLRAGAADCTYYGDCYPAFYAQDGSGNSFLGNEIYANYWIGGSDGGVTFNGSTSGNKYYLYDGTPAAAFCDIRSSTLTWADGGADLPFSSELSCLLDSDSYSRWQGSGEDYRPYVGACSPQMDITSLPANLTCANTVYTLRGNFTVEPTDTNVITVVANNVAVDCAGNSINGQGSQYGIYSARSGTHVLNCDLRDFNHASIYFTSSSNNGVENTYADDGKSGIVFEGVSDSYIRNSTGLGVGDYGIYLYSCTGVNVTNSTGTVASGSYGIYLESSSGVRIINSTGSVTENGNYGIYLASSEDTAIESCTAYNIENDAMGIYNSPRTAMTGCSLTTDATYSAALNMYDSGEEMRTDNGTFTRNSFNAIGSGSEALLLQAVGTGGNTFLDNTFTSDRWVVSYSEDENFFNNSLKGNRYYLANGTGAWEIYNISSSTNGTWADQGSDLPFSAALPSPGTYPLEQYVDGSPSGWVNNDFVNDQDWSTGSVPETESAHLTKFYPAPSSTPRNISVKVGTDLGTIVLPVPGDGYDGITTRIDILSRLEPAQVAVYYFNHSTGIFGEFQLLYEINGTSQLNESSIIWTLDMRSPWAGNDVDWHPHLVPRPNVFGNGSSIHTSGSSSLSNVTAAISGNTDVNGTEQDDVKTVNISNSGATLFVFDYNFTDSSLNFSAVSIAQGTVGGKAYASITGLNSSNIVGGKTLYMYNADTSISNVCVKDEEGAVYTAISATCTAANEHSVACDGISHSGYTCAYNGTTAIIAGLQHSAAIQLSSTPSPTPTPSPSGGSSNNGGGSIGIGLIMPPIKQTTIYNVSMGGGKTCPISITRSMSSALNLSVLTTTLENVGGSGCSMSDFVFNDTLPSDFPALNAVAFNPQYASRAGWTVSFSFPSFAAGESKILTYSANQWVRPSLAKNFTAYAMSAKVQQEVQPATPAAPTAPEQPSAWVPRKLSATSSGQQSAGASSPILMPSEAPSMLGFAAMLGAVAVVAGGVLFFIWKGRKKKQGL